MQGGKSSGSSFVFIPISFKAGQCIFLNNMPDVDSRATVSRHMAQTHIILPILEISIEF